MLNPTSIVDNLYQFGVPKDFVPGPLLFLIFVNDIHNTLLSTMIIKLFADDINCFLSGLDINELKLVVQYELTSLMQTN